jgi:hypothetical protein
VPESVESDRLAPLQIGPSGRVAAPVSSRTWPSSRSMRSSRTPVTAGSTPTSPSCPRSTHRGRTSRRLARWCATRSSSCSRIGEGVGSRSPTRAGPSSSRSKSRREEARPRAASCRSWLRGRAARSAARDLGETMRVASRPPSHVIARSSCRLHAASVASSGFRHLPHAENRLLPSRGRRSDRFAWRRVRRPGASPRFGSAEPQRRSYLHRTSRTPPYMGDSATLTAPAWVSPWTRLRSPRAQAERLRIARRGAARASAGSRRGRSGSA